MKNWRMRREGQALFERITVAISEDSDGQLSLPFPGAAVPAYRLHAG